MTLRGLARTAACMILLWAFTSPDAFGQLRIVGSISGTVQDSNGAVIADAKVVLKDVKTGIIKETSSSERGTFLFPDLASGVYEVTVTAPGFQTSLLSN